MSPKPCCGFVLHFGYVEDGHVSMMLINCQDEGFDTVEEGARDLAKYFLTDYLYGITSCNNSQEKRKRFQERFQKEFVIRKVYPTLVEFQQWLIKQSTATADTWGLRLLDESGNLVALGFHAEDVPIPWVVLGIRGPG